MEGRVALAVAMLVALAGVACGGEQASSDEQPSESESQPAAEVQVEVPTPPGGPGGERDSIDVSDEELRSFVRAQLRYGRARTRIQARMDSAGSREQTRQLREELNQEMAEIVREEGLERDRFVEILRALPHSDDLQRRYAAVRQQLSDRIGRP